MFYVPAAAAAAAAAAAMAARLLVSPLSRPARKVFLQSLQKSPGINPVFRFRLNSNPEPKRPNPVHDMALRFQSTKARPFSTGSESDHRAFSTECRRRLGIDDSPVLLDPCSFKPPRGGEIKINFSATIAEDHNDEGDYDPSLCTGGITALARNSSGDVLGLAKGYMKYTRGNKLELQLYALKAAANLAKELKSLGMHGGPVVYESSSHALVTCVFDGRHEGDPDEEVLRSNMPRDEYLEEVGRSCRFYCGTKDRLKEIMPDDLFDVLLDRTEKEKALEARPSSTGSESVHRLHWATEYRRRLGIGDSLVRLPAEFLPEKDGEIKIIFGASSITGTTKEGERHNSGAIMAIARKSSGDLLGVTKGTTKYKGGDILELSLYGLKAASNLAKEIKRTGMHDGPVVYVPGNPLLAEYFHRDCEREPKKLRRNMPRDEELEEAGQSCTIYCGSREKLKEILPDDIFRRFVLMTTG